MIDFTRDYAGPVRNALNKIPIKRWQRWMTEMDDRDAQDAGGHVPRINQLDAATLDEELLSSFHEQISEAFRYFIRLCQNWWNVGVFLVNFPCTTHFQKPLGHNRSRVGHPGEMRPVEIHCFGPGVQHRSVSPRDKVLHIFIKTVDPRGNRHNLKLFESTAIPGHQKPPGERRN